MKRRQFIHAAMAGATVSTLAAPKQRPPNLVFLLADDLRFDAAGFMGHPEVKTPNLDRLAECGTVFENAYDTTAICMASRAQLMTGRLEFSTGCNFEHGPMAWSIWEKSYPMLLRRNGYYTGFAGKFGFDVEPQGKAKGANLVRPCFDWWGGWMGQGSYEVGANREATAWHEKHAGEKEHTSYALGVLGREFIREAGDSDKPFCLSISFKAPHSPYQTDPRYDEVYADTVFTRPENFGPEAATHLPKHPFAGRPPTKGKGWIKDFDGTSRKYHQLVYGMDAAVGMIMDELERQGVADNTVVIFTSDNGYFNGSKGFAGKIYAYEEASRAPFILYDPRHRSAGKKMRINQLTGNIDVTPTLLDLAGVPVPEGVQGKSVLPMLDDPTHRNHDSLPLLNVWGARPAHSLAVVSTEWKYIHWFYGADGYEPTEELYSMKSDRLETRNLAGSPEQQHVLAAMQKKYDLWLGVWAKEGVDDNGYRKYIKLADRSFDWKTADRDLIESMGALNEAERNSGGKDKSANSKKAQKKARKAGKKAG
jgi:arylsulfatase A-like enzyme